jgi:hypothetical protein
MNLPALCAVMLMALPAVAGAQSFAPQTTWVNDHGSVLVIQSIGPDGSLTGTYSNSAPGSPCNNVAFPLAGWVDGDRIIYAIRRKNAAVDCGSVTSWTAYLYGGRLYAEWSLAYWDSASNRPMPNRGVDSYIPR